MTQKRPAVPISLKRKLLEEAGYRCAIPTCRTPSPLDMEHIEPWSKVKSHEFENMIILCPNCHARVTRGEISKEAIKTYKRNLAIISGRYSLYEIRLLELAYQQGAASRPGWGYPLQETDLLHVKGVLDDGLFQLNRTGSVVKMAGVDVSPVFIVLTENGRDFIRKYFSGESIR